MSNSARGQDLRNALKNFISVTQILTSDMLEAHKSLDKEKSNQVWARIFIRAFAAYIEGAIHGLKQTALQVAAITQVELKAAFCAILKIGRAHV